MPTKTKTFSISLETQRKIDALKEYLGMTNQSAVIQMAINEYYKKIEEEERARDKYEHL